MSVDEGRASKALGRGFRLVLSAAVGTAAVSALAGTAHAQTAGSLDWDAVAECESGQDWAANTGNGYFGGLQFSEGTWREHGGVGLPHEFSREDQIRIAERVLSTQGPGAWPNCARSTLAEGVTAAEAFSFTIADEDVEPLYGLGPCAPPAAALQSTPADPAAVQDADVRSEG
ncbi:transglycosylase family protein [Umezawaea sp. Da 62-37]|uniref:transglycosylase family protein n=1 Tax=Umezawaea sp. Da 62-37 TaxID=3075927 RepID=UPI0028F6D956|nr:transglycosylase family protein [Umezawaea sp. Da 62-37]WNV83933.1 transglycosylase family protein [Umezawaea sp. Da 62-37]